MYHIRLIRGMSYSGAVTATRSRPDVFTDDETAYTSAMESGYFADLTRADEKMEHDKESPKWEDVKESHKVDLEERDAFSDMNVDELKAYAEANGINIAGAKKKADIIETIREAEKKAAEARIILRGEQ